VAEQAKKLARMSRVRAALAQDPDSSFFLVCIPGTSKSIRRSNISLSDFVS
jgi:hypothetical protein